MGGDYAPEAAVKGAVMALDAIGPDSRIVLFGDEAKVKAVLAAEGCPAERFDIVATTEVIEMGDHPAKAFQAKADSSITVGFGYLAKGAIDGFASAGSTGAMMVGSMYAVKPIEGVIRPTISSIIPTVTGHPALLLDVGLNVDCKPEVLAQYGLIGSIYAEAVLGIRKPRVAVLNIGEEDTKGSQFAQEAHGLLRERLSNFAGNAEGSDILPANFDVIITDGFTGNVCLKTIEGTSKTLFKTLKSIMMSTPLTKLGALAIKGGLKQLMAQVSPDTYGGAPLLGVKGALLVGHGSSNALAVKNGVLTTARIARTGVSDIIAQTVATPCAAEATEGE